MQDLINQIEEHLKEKQRLLVEARSMKLKQMTTNQIEQAHKDATNSERKCRGFIAGEIEYPGELIDE